MNECFKQQKKSETVDIIPENVRFSYFMYLYIGEI